MPIGDGSVDGFISAQILSSIASLIKRKAITTHFPPGGAWGFAQGVGTL